jgi:hypothetical protein
MNGICGDSLEGLCYKSFISIDESTTVLQLSGMLPKVLSLFVRLNLAKKVTIDNEELTAKCMGAVYDCNLPVTLMLGNLDQTVKSFAVTLLRSTRLLESWLEFRTFCGSRRRRTAAIFIISFWCRTRFFTALALVPGEPGSLSIQHERLTSGKKCQVLRTIQIATWSNGI